MFRNLILGIAVAVGGSVAFAHADAKEEVTAAAKRLHDAGSYSWTSTVEGGRGMSRATEGQTHDGLTRLVLPMRDDSIEVLMRGDKVAVHTPDEGWQAVEAPERGQRGDRADRGPGGPGAGPGRMIGGLVRGFTPPAEQALNLLESVENLEKRDDGTYVGTLNEEGARSMLQGRAGRAPGGRDGAAPRDGRGRDGAGRDGGGRDGGPGGFGAEVIDPKATVHFRVSDGVLAGMEMHVTGRISFNGEERDVDRTTTIEIQNVGATSIDVPEEAKQVLD